MGFAELLLDLAVTKGLREALPFFEHLVREAEDLPATRIIEEARAAGLSFRDSGAFNLISQLKANLKIEEVFKLTAFDRVPSVDTLVRSTAPLNKNYSFLVSIKGFNPVTAERERRFVTIVSDNLLTPEQILESALSLPSGREGSQILSNATVTIESGIKSTYAP